MVTSWKRSLRRLLPPCFAELYERRFRRVRYMGDFASWDEARAASTGYDSQAIVNQVVAAAREVREGRAAFERDGVAFKEPTSVWPVVTFLMRAAAREQGQLRVLDFGGSLGSLYFQHRALWRGLAEVRWAIVEQPSFVVAGRKEFATEELSFYEDIQGAVRACAPTIALLSGVVNWIEQPHVLLDEIVRRSFPAILLDRTAIATGGGERLAVQRVPAHVYRASYPTWLLTREGLLAHFAESYELKCEFPAQDLPVDGAEFRGFYFERRT